MSLRKRLPVGGQADSEDFDAAAEPSGPVAEPRVGNPLIWEVRPPGKPSYDVDLTRLADGFDPRTGRGKGRGDHSGRAVLAAELARELRSETARRAQTHTTQVISHLSTFWRFLDHLERAGAKPVATSLGVTDDHGQLFKTWLLHDQRLKAKSAQAPLSLLQLLLSRARKRAGSPQPELVWPSIGPGRDEPHKDVPPEVLRLLYNTLKAHHKRCGRAFAEGSALLATGVDPRTVDASHRESAWSERANIVVLAKIRFDMLAVGVKQPKTHPWFDSAAAYGRPRHVPPMVDPQDRETLHRTTRWFAPGFKEACAAFLMTAMHFGWNPETVANIDVSDGADWYDSRLQGQMGRKGTVAIYAMKDRTGKEQIAVSLTEPETHPYQLIVSMLERTRHLREALTRRRLEISSSPRLTVAKRRALEKIDRALRSPWLYLTQKRGVAGTRVGFVDPRNRLREAMRTFCLEAMQQALAKEPDMPDSKRQALNALAMLTPSDLRDGFAAFVYDNSLSNILLLKQGLGHARLGATVRYLRQRRQLSQRFAEYRRFQDTLFDEIVKFQRVDPTILYLRARYEDVSDEQRHRLAEHRSITRMGMGCLDPYHPPADVAPAHTSGPCATHRCTLCRHGVLFKDSFEGLAVRMGELWNIRERVPSERFEGSSFQSEWIAIDATVDRFFAPRRQEFESLAQARLELLRAGKAYLFEQMPAYPKDTTR